MVSRRNTPIYQAGEILRGKNTVLPSYGSSSREERDEEAVVIREHILVLVRNLRVRENEEGKRDDGGKNEGGRERGEYGEGGREREENMVREGERRKQDIERNTRGRKEREGDKKNV